ncbi:hypothetical protein SAMN05880501_108117 [Ureibacillus xyleni]|uniref:Uncharacterized protein n=1 Tax=Ureibacillus xyleni TaxID=614648 RepID=A0A285T4C3_9BACL|nr:hypothetical protein [Ureibacillus xyleni]SOC15620.1 hypothetical protein SAMN05880501_108117 [Ureibacillus xyleni]
MGKKVVAGSNEVKFRNYFEGKFGQNILGGKRNYQSDDKLVSISVDNSIQIGNKEILIEIDSGNMAKLLVGQYVLLNQLYNRNHDGIFLIIHYYKDQDGNEYNPKRTEYNLSFVNETIYENNALTFKVFNQSSFEKLCEQCHSLQDFINHLFS